MCLGSPPSLPTMAQLIPFAALTGGTETVRFTVINGGTYMSIRDIIMVVCKKDSQRAWETWDRLDAEKKEELSLFCGTFQFPGQGQRVQPVIALEGALKVIMWLPGDMAKDYRSKACSILTRFLGGDSGRSKPTQRLMRRAMCYMSIRDIITVVCKKKPNDTADTWRDMSDEKKNEVAEFRDF